MQNETKRAWLCRSCYWTYANYRVQNFKKFERLKKKRERAGIFIQNPKSGKILVVQTFHKYIGIPKGGKEEGETTSQTAIRELYEETGITLDKIDENKKIVMDRTCTYYTLETDRCYQTKLIRFDGNDVSGVGWVHPECLHKIHGVVTSHLLKMIKRQFPGRMFKFMETLSSSNHIVDTEDKNNQDDSRDNSERLSKLLDKVSDELNDRPEE